LFIKARYSSGHGHEREGEVKMCGIFVVGDIKYIKMWVESARAYNRLSFTLQAFTNV